MKKAFLLSCLVLCALMSFAQTKKVAILEVEDASNQLTNAQKLMLRSNLSRAVTNTKGYEAYNRSDMDAIMREHLFQRSGNVNSDQIRELGRMTGVSLILTTKAVRSGNQLFVDAAILNVETAQQELQDNMIMGLTAEDMQKGCEQLARRLFGVTATSSGIEKYNIERMGPNEYIYMGKYMGKKEYEYFLRNNCPKAYGQYRIGKQLIYAGWGVFAAGIAITGAGIGMLASAGYMETETGGGGMVDGGIALMAVGPSLMVVGSVPLLTIGYVKRNRAYKVYNNTCASSSAAPLSLNLTAGSNGLGLALQF